MTYKEFDKDLSPREIRKKILNLLEERPYERKNLIETINAPDSKVEHQLAKLIREGEVDKKFINNVWFYGLTYEYRNQVKINKQGKVKNE